MTRSYYDDNFGFYEIETEEDIAHYHYVQSVSVRKKCKGCKRTVKIKPEYAYCNSCATKIEQGWDLEY